MFINGAVCSTKYRLAAERFVSVAAYNVEQTNILIVFFREQIRSTGAPIILGRRPSLSAHESESMLRTYLVCRERERERERERATSKRHVGVADSVLTEILIPQRLSCY
jgi:hypothetical protein